jgi:hypothetical protein
MAEESNKGNIKQEYNVAAKGLNLDNSQNNIDKGILSYALNAAMENFDANSFQYQNEPGNEYCFDFPEGFQLLGKYFIPEKQKIIFWLKNDETGESELGYMVNNDCVYRKLVNADCLNFDINRPILSGAHRILDNGDVEIYWADNNGRRFLNINKIPYLPLSTSEPCDPKDSTRLDCNAILLQPDLSIPLIEAVDVISGGEITSGTYQFTVQYGDADGNPYTAYYNVTNPMPIADVETATVNFDIPVGKSIVVDIKNLDPNGTYEYFNLTVIKTINNISTPELVGTYFIDDTSKQIIYTGQNKTNIQLSIDDIFEKFAFYEGADYVTAVQDILVWKGMKPTRRLSYQKIANQITLKWQTWRLPPSDEGYANEVNAGNLRSYLRDEVYAFEVVFLLNNGKETDAFHIPGRIKSAQEVSKPLIQVTNPDYIGDGKNPSEYWEVYNTATVEGFNSEYDPNNEDYKGPYQRGEFAYWESTEEYPCDEDIWGDLAGQKIRHHKFPDCRISPIIENPELSNEGNPIMKDVAIFPIGVKIDSDQIKRLIEQSELTQAEKDQIVGYKITRADRGVNKSIIAKGMLRNVNKYTREEQDFFYPNYPYNDVRQDPFINSSNNAWSALCEEYTIEVNNLPLQPNGENYVEIEYIDCNNNKKTTRKIREIGKTTQCSITRPRWISIGNYDISTNPTIFFEFLGNQVAQDWRSVVPQPSQSADANLYPSNYDVYRINWKNFNLGSAGARNGWDDIIQNEQKSIWLQYEENVIVRVPVGLLPFCSDNSCFRSGSGNQKMNTPVLVEEVRVETCRDATPLTPISENEELLSRQIFNSPETSFGQPFLGNILSLETVMYGGGKAHFVEVKDNAKYRLITKEAQEDALATAERVASLTQAFNLEAMFAVYNAQLTIFRNEITKRNFAKSFNSIASYNYAEPVPKELGIKNRNLDIKRYLIPEVLNVGEDDININNFQRETSVYLRATETIPLPDNVLETQHSVNIKDKSRFTISEIDNCSTPEKEEDISVVSYYGALKNRFINQYGQIYSYESIDTGFVKVFNDNITNNDVIWGGDTYIGKFAYKTKLPFFLDNRVNFPDDSDIFYDEIGNIGYPAYWHSARSILETWQGSNLDLRLDNFLSYKARNFDCPNNQELNPENANPDTNPDRTFYDGYFYMFAYGVPSFYCESSYNLDLRTAFNNREGDFWPHVSSGIPDDWVQETNVPIVQDNTYNYNVTFSKQNKESVITNLPANWNEDNEIESYPFRAVYSDKQISNVNNRLNNWLIYRPLSYFDFPQNYGNLTALDSLQNAAILARFENKSLLYNSLVTIDTSNPQAAFVGNPNLFANQPIDYGDTDQGYMGSQNKMLLKTPYGALSIDAKRGHVFLINGKQAQDLSQFGSGMHRWFTAHLPFEITKYFPGVDTDNHFKDVGLHGVFDSNFERVIITKLDYIPLDDRIEFKNNKYYITENEIEKEIFLIDSDYFCNVSWTISFNFNSKSWISFHSYVPNWYVGENNFFYSGLNYCPNDFDALVGVLDTTIPSTTTTTTLPLTTTTSTTIPVIPVDCTFDVTAESVDCLLSGEAVFVGNPPPPVCTRPSNLISNVMYSGYNYQTVDYDTTGSSTDACQGLSYYLAQSSIPDLTITILPVQGLTFTVGDVIYLNNGTDDCSYPSDGWYYSDETANTDQSIFRIENGIIVETFICGTVVNPTTTTTTSSTTIPPATSVCITGIYSNPDPLNPLGGVIEYIDENGDPQTLTGVYDNDSITITYIEVLSSSGIVLCDSEVTTTTTTTTV